MRVCPRQPHVGAVGSQLNVPDGLYSLGGFQKLGNLMCLVTKYMWKYVELVQSPSLHALTPGSYHLTSPERAYSSFATHLATFCACLQKIDFPK